MLLTLLGYYLSIVFQCSSWRIAYKGSFRFIPQSGGLFRLSAASSSIATVLALPSLWGPCGVNVLCAFYVSIISVGFEGSFPVPLWA